MKKLDLSYNRITTLNIENKQLENIDLSYNNISEINDLKTPNLITINLSFNKLYIIPNFLFLLPLLNSIVLTQNFISRSQLLQMEGFDEFNKRRIDRINKGIQSNIINEMDICGLTF